MSETSADILATLATQPWRPQSLRQEKVQWLSRRWRLTILGAVVLLHLLGSYALLKILAAGHRDSEETVMLVDFIERAPLPPLEPLPAAQTPPAVEPHRKPVPRPTTKPRRKPKAAPLQALITDKPETPPPVERARASSQRPALQLYDSNGRVRVPDDLLDQMDRQFGDKRVFSYQVPHIDDAKKYFSRNPALAYEVTRFDEYWTPDQDMLTELLTKAVEKTTREIRIPVPGRPGSTLVCTVSILALGGGCGVQMNGSHYVGPVDDPETLSASEERQCAAWWQQIIGARTQEAWRKTRSLYDAQCRKPLEKIPAVLQ